MVSFRSERYAYFDVILNANSCNIPGNLNPNFDLWQGLLNLYPCTSTTGGTVVVLKSHQDTFKRIFRDDYRKKARRQKHFVMLNRPTDFDKYCKDAVQLRLDPGDFLVWDSRVIHCNQGMNESCLDSHSLTKVASKADMSVFESNNLLSRLVAYICMAPKYKLENKPNVIKTRKMAVLKGLTGPHKVIINSKDLQRSRKAENNDRLREYRPPSAKSPIWNLVS